MGRVPITVMGYRCERCGHEWIPRGDSDEEPRVCPKCKSAYWNRPPKKATDYEGFSAAIRKVLSGAQGPLTWTEVRNAAGLSQAFPNNKWVHRLEEDIKLERKRDSLGIIRWSLTPGVDQRPDKAS